MISRTAPAPTLPPTVRRAVAAAAPAVESVETRRLFAAPAFDAVANYSVPVGKTIQIPLTSTSTGGSVTYTARDSSGNVLESQHVKHTFIEMDVAGYSQPMVFELFNDVAPETVRRITGLINAGFYNGLTFHRIINNFVIQGGDPAGDGTGGPQFTFDDEFNANTVFTGTGQLAMANSGKDTNGSQFFITEGPQRLLDFNHTIFGQLVRGESTRAAISDVNTDSATGAPTTPVVISKVRVLRDTSDGVLVVKATKAGSYGIKVTATNSDGSTSRRFTVTSAADTINDPPILNTSSLQPVYYTTPNTPVTIDLSSTDIEGNSGNVFVAQYVTQNAATGAFGTTDASKITLTPTTGGLTSIKVGVVGASTDQSRGSTQITSGDTTGISIADSQLIRIASGDLPISATAYDFGASSGVSTGTLSVASFRSSDAGDTAANFTASIDWGDGTVTDSATVTKSRNGRYTVSGAHTYADKASGTLPITVTVTGDKGAYAQAKSSATVHAITSLADGVLSIYGTSAADNIGVSRKKRVYNVSVNGANKSFATSAISKLILYGYAGNDVITVGRLVYTPASIDGAAGNDVLNGGAGDDTISGGDGADTITTGNGANRVGGGTGNDTITGGDGSDRIDGEDGNDVINGGGGRDYLNGGAGNDRINGGDGADVIDGGAGRDTVVNDVLDSRTNVEARA